MKLLKPILAVCLFVMAAPALAVEPSEMLRDPALEARARDISEHLRCVVCQNQTIDDSNAPLAHDMRLLVRERLMAGDSDRQVIDYIVARYGDFVLLRPPWQPDTWALWIAPFAIFALALLGLFSQVRRRSEAAPPPLSADERRRLNQLLTNAKQPPPGTGVS
ncbi:MAG: cytochrome c-type biogenesis protein CcmH [Proteobacteria bacterium]|nr:cytochrome c-type biogenesis protein CcmH [Pseudomonadota bacterium]